MHFSSPKGVSVPSIAGRVLRGDGLFHRWEHGLERVREAEPVLAWELRVVSVPSIAGRVLRGEYCSPETADILFKFQCPPSRAGSCGADVSPYFDNVIIEFQCPPSRAGSCGASSPVPVLRAQILVSVPSIAGRVLRVKEDPKGASEEGRDLLFQCPPSRAGSCGRVTTWVERLERNPQFQCPPSRAGSCGSAAPSSPARTASVSVPSIAGRVLRELEAPVEDAEVMEFQCPPSRAGSCGGQQLAADLQVPGHVSVPSIAGRVLRDDTIHMIMLAVIFLFQCPPSRAGSCGA